jgi:hypothetical protein
MQSGTMKHMMSFNKISSRSGETGLEAASVIFHLYVCCIVVKLFVIFVGERLYCTIVKLFVGVL